VSVDQAVPSPVLDRVRALEAVTSARIVELPSA